MFPQFDLFGITVYSFGLSLSLAFLAFFFILYRLSLKIGINTNFFLGNALPLFLSTFLASRLFYIVAQWRDFQFVFSEGGFRFFFMSDYNFSLIGGVFGFLAMLFVLLRVKKLPAAKFLDAVVLSFLCAGTIAFVGAFFGGQVLGKPTDLPIGIQYGAAALNNPYTSPVLPLGLLYAAASFLLFSGLYIFRTVVKTDGLAGYFGIILFSCVYIVGEAFSGRADILRTYSGASIAQIGFFLLLVLAARWIYRMTRRSDGVGLA